MTTQGWAQTDKAVIESLLREGVGIMKGTGEDNLFFARKFLGKPYVGKTLEVNMEERLVVNTRQLDCTTLVETVVALTMTAREGKADYKSFSNNILYIRYKDGMVSYPTRLHYFTQWIDNAVRRGIAQTNYSNALYSASQNIRLRFMSSHPELYPAIKRSAEVQKKIAETEKLFDCDNVAYIPKARLKEYGELRKVVKNGDVIAIVTNKKGLDISHVGFASWHKDGTLHLLNASQIRKKVIDESMTLYEYMSKHPSQLGIRVISF